MPPTVYWVLDDQTTGKSQTITPAGNMVTAFINPGDNYLVAFEAQEAGGIKTISLGAQGEAICNGNRGAYTEANPYQYTIPNQTLTFTELANKQAYTQAFFPYFFSLQATASSTAVSACGSQVPMFGTTTYNGQATNYGGASSGTTSLAVTTCVSGSC